MSKTKRTIAITVSSVLALALSASAQVTVKTTDAQGNTATTVYRENINSSTAVGADLGTATLIPLKRTPGQSGRDKVEWTVTRCESFDMDGTPHWTSGACPRAK